MMNAQKIIIGIIGIFVVLGLGFIAIKSKNKIALPVVNPGILPAPPVPLPPVVNPVVNPTIKKAQFGVSISVKLNEKISFPDGLSVTLKEINDSRCPSGVQCIWAGEISGNFAVSGGKLSVSKDVRLGTTNNKSVTLDDYIFSLKDAAINSIIISVLYKNPTASLPACFVGGCSGQICSDEKDIVSNCEFKAAYACYRTATCERQTSGQCGWTQTPALLACLANP